MSRKIAVLFSLLVLASTAAFALEREPFSQQRFQALQSADAVVLVDIYATWRPDCKKQQEILEYYAAARPDVPLHVLQADFDHDKGTVKAFRAPRQSTLVLYKGSRQLWFSVAETREEQIFQALDAAFVKK